MNLHLISWALFTEFIYSRYTLGYTLNIYENDRMRSEIHECARVACVWMCLFVTPKVFFWLYLGIGSFSRLTVGGEQLNISGLHLHYFNSPTSCWASFAVRNCCVCRKEARRIGMTKICDTKLFQNNHKN